MWTPGARSGLGLEDYLLLFAVAVLPWAFGGVEMWAYRSASLLIAAAFAWTLVTKGSEGLGLARADRIWLVPAVLLALWAAFQLVPLPPSVVAALSPEADRIYGGTQIGYRGDESATSEGRLAALEREALRRVPEVAGVPVPPQAADLPDLTVPVCKPSGLYTLSLQPTATQERLFWYLSLLMAFVLARGRVSSPARYRVYRWVVFSTVVGLAVFALVQAQTWNGKIYWVRRITTSVYAYGPFVNPTNLAGVMELAVPWLAGYALFRLGAKGREALREARFSFAAVGTVLCTAAAVGAASKAGVVLVAAGLTAVAFRAARTGRQRAVLLGVVAAGALALPFLLRGSRLAERLDEFVTYSSVGELGGGRVPVWLAGLDLFGDFPLTGVGFGAFREVFPRYMLPGQEGWLDQAHNDYLEVAISGGVPAALLVLWMAGAFAWRVFRRFRGRRISTARIGLAAGVAALAVHALADFNHQIPGVALLWVTACACLLPAGRRERELGTEP